MISAKAVNQVKQEPALCSQSIGVNFSFHMSHLRRFVDSFCESMMNSDLEKSFLITKIQEYKENDRPVSLTVAYMMNFMVRLYSNPTPAPEDENEREDEEILPILKICSKYIKTPSPEIADTIIKVLGLYFNDEEFQSLILKGKWIKEIRQRSSIMKKPSKLMHLFSHRRRKVTWSEIRA